MISVTSRILIMNGFNLHTGLDNRKPENEASALMHEHFFGGHGERRVKELHKASFHRHLHRRHSFSQAVPQVTNVQNSADLKKTSVAQDDVDTKQSRRA